MPFIILLNSVADIPENICFFVVADSQITITYFLSIEKANIKIVCREPLFFRLRITCLFQAKKNLFAF